jgi:hypothetical protein
MNMLKKQHHININTMRKFEELTEAEKALRSLIFAVESKDLHNPHHPFPMGEAYLSHILQDAKQVAEKLKIPLCETLTVDIVLQKGKFIDEYETQQFDDVEPEIVKIYEYKGYNYYISQGNFVKVCR